MLSSTQLPTTTPQHPPPGPSDPGFSEYWHNEIEYEVEDIDSRVFCNNTGGAETVQQMFLEIRRILDVDFYSVGPIQGPWFTFTLVEEKEDTEVEGEMCAYSGNVTMYFSFEMTTTIRLEELFYDEDIELPYTQMIAFSWLNVTGHNNTLFQTLTLLENNQWSSINSVPAVGLLISTWGLVGILGGAAIVLLYILLIIFSLFYCISECYRTTLIEQQLKAHSVLE